MPENGHFKSVVVKYLLCRGRCMPENGHFESVGVNYFHNTPLSRLVNQHFLQPQTSIIPQVLAANLSLHSSISLFDPLFVRLFAC